MKKARLFLPLLIVIYVFILSFGVATMTMDKDGNMSFCPLMVGGSFCQMSVFEHISIFQNMFTSISQNSFYLLVSLLFVAVPLIKQLKPTPQKRPTTNSQVNQFKPSFFSQFLLGLSDGILQPKLYA